MCVPAGHNPLTSAGYIPYLILMNTVDAFLILVDTFSSSVKLAEATVSSRLFNDGKRISGIRGGSDIGVRRLQVAISWLSDHWPEGVIWPDYIPRPKCDGISPVKSLDMTEVQQ